jgi:hypothetical protein
MLGIEDKWVALAYLLCIGSMLLCVLYGWRNWNRGEEEIKQEDIHWAAEEDKAEEKL